MFRTAAAFAVAACLVAFAVACDDDDAESEACPISGSYTLPEGSITCPDTDAGGTVDITSLGDDKYRAFIHGLGECGLTRTDACKVYGACQVTARNDAGTELASGDIQVSWEFTERGFNGTTYFQTPTGQENCTSIQPVTQVATRK